MAKTKTRTSFVCQDCGAQRPKWEGQCRDCGEWNTLVEEVITPPEQSRGWALGSAPTTATGYSDHSVTLDQSLQDVQLKRNTTGLAELDRVLGGGLVPGSFVLLGGSPGIGKSTLLLQMAGGFANEKLSVLYVSAEESVGQTALRAQRLGIRSPQVTIRSDARLEAIIDHAKRERPSVLVVDSIQTVFLSEIQSAPGSVSQVRESAARLMALAKTENICVILIGHVTKEGSLAGPKTLEHMVDCVLSFEGDPNYHFRLLRSMKNRFGPAGELGVFQMNSEGLQEVANPSEMFLEERGTELIGSAVFCSIEGSRPLLCEVQALTIASHMAMPRRTSLGIDINRLHLLTAVLDRHLELNLVQSDIFINVVGGLKLMEPATDLAVAAAILSTDSRTELHPKSCYFGEIGLTGEVRAVPFVDLRIKEAAKLGFEKFIIPKSNQKHLKNMKELKGKDVTWVVDVRGLNSSIS